jgi:hypothetical protein
LCRFLLKVWTILLAYTDVIFSLTYFWLCFVLAGVEAMLDPKFNLHGNSATTMGATPCLLVNGPVVAEAEINCEHGALSSGSRANASIGRALKLVLQNVGGAKLGGTESTTLGNPCKFTFCVAENAGVLQSFGGTSPWPSQSFEDGFAPSDSAVSLIAITGGPNQLVDFTTTDPDELIALLAGIMAVSYRYGSNSYIV